MKRREYSKKTLEALPCLSQILWAHKRQHLTKNCEECLFWKLSLNLRISLFKYIPEFAKTQTGESRMKLKLHFCST